MKTLVITSALNGFMVEIGCTKLVFDNKAKLLHELSRYIDNPPAVEEEYLDKYIVVNYGPQIQEPDGGRATRKR